MMNPFEDDDALNQYCEEVVFSVLTHPTRTSFGYRASCPVCHEGSSGNRKKRFQYYKDTHSAFCFNSGCPISETGKSGLQLTAILKGYVQSVENSEYIKWYQKNITSTSKKIDEVNKMHDDELDAMNPNLCQHAEKNFEVKQEDDGLFEDSWVDLPSTVKEYCKQRKIFEAPFAPKNWNLYYDIISKRLVIPWIEDEKIVYYQKRALLRGDDPKYIYPSNSHRPIFNVDLIDKSFPYVFATEGAIDCCFLKNGIACGGLTPSIDQREELRERFPGFKIVILTDNQWIDKSARLALLGDYRSGTRGLIESGMNDFMFFIWPKISGCYYKDINECCCSNSSYHDFGNADWLLAHTYDPLQAKFSLFA